MNQDFKQAYYHHHFLLQPKTFHPLFKLKIEFNFTSKNSKKPITDYSQPTSSSVHTTMQE